MPPELYLLAANTVLIFHFGIVIFNVIGLIAIPLGAWRNWSFARIYWWRLLHVVLMAAVVLQAYLGRACFLTLWQAALEERGGEAASIIPMIQRWIETAVFWPLPIGIFALTYSMAFAYCVALWWLVPPVRVRR